MLVDPIWDLEARPPLYGQTFTRAARRLAARWGTKRRVGARSTPAWLPLVERVETGLYASASFNPDQLLSGSWDSFGPWKPKPGESFQDFYKRATSVTRYGACDSIKQFKETVLYAQLAGAAERYVVTFVFIRKSVQPRHGGWQWHKWGPYLGNHAPEHEYLYDEEGIESVACFRVHEECQP